MVWKLREKRQAIFAKISPDGSCWCVQAKIRLACITTLIQDSLSMVVVDASFEPDGSIIIDFSKPVSVGSITQQNIYVIASSTVTGTVISGADPSRIIFYPQIALNNPPIPFVLKVEATVVDQGGHALEYPFSKMFNAGSGNSFVQGEVWDNASGQPLAGAVVTQIAPVVTPAPVATADAMGQFTMPVSSGNVVLRVERSGNQTDPGYLTSYRSVSIASGEAVFMFDARLQPVDTKVITLGSSASSVTNSDATVSLIAPAGTVTADTQVVLSKRDGQSLPALLPDGWAPIAAASIDSSTSSLQQQVTLRIKNDTGMGAFSSMPTAYYDISSNLWKTGPSGFVSADGTQLELQTNRTGTHAFLLFDPSNPPAPSLADQPLLAAAPQAPGTAGTPNLVATPTGIYPQQRAQVITNFSGAQFRSGTRFQAILKEDFTLLAGLGSVQTTPKTADLVGYSMGQPSSGEVKFFASPSKAIDFTKLDVGFIDVEIHAFPHDTAQPGVIGSSGGSVQSADGSMTLTVPAGALTGSVPVTLTSLSVADLTLVVPGYTMVSAFEVSFGGASLSSAATVDAVSGAGVSPAFILARLAQIGSTSRWIIEGTASYDGVRIKTVAGLATLRGVTVSGVYGIFRADAPIGFITGSISNPQNGAAGQNILVTSDQTQLAALSNNISTYTLAVPVSSGAATAANQVTGDSGSANYTVSSQAQVVTVNLHINTTPPRIVSITPADASTGVSSNTTIRVTFSEAVLASSLNSSTFKVLVSGSPVTGRILLTSNNTIGIFTPSTALASDTQYTITLTSAITDLSGNALSNPTTTHTFRTADTTAPQPASTTRFKLFLPENGNVRFEVPEADIEPGTALIFFNDTKRTSTTANTAACTAGGPPASCFTATIAGSMTDAYFVELVDASGNKTRVDFARMEYSDGSGAVFETTGGEYTTSEGIVIEVAADTFTSATPVQLKMTTPDPQTVTPTPRDFANIGYFTLNTNGATAAKPIEVSFPVPAGANITADSQIFAAVPVEFFGKKKWMAVEPLQLEDGMLKTLSPPWPGIRVDPLYTLIQSVKPLFYLQGSVSSVPAVIEFSNTDLSIFTQTPQFVAPLPVGEPYSITATDFVTGAIIFEGQPAPPATEAQSIVHLQKVISNDTTPPYMIGGSPLTITSWKVGASSGNVRANITFSTDDSGADGVADFTGTLTVTGDRDALAADSYASVHNNTTGQSGTGTASSVGSFQVSVPYTFSDPITLLLSSVDVEPGAVLRFNFSEPIEDTNYGTLLDFYETLDTTQKIAFSFQLKSAQQTLEIRPLTNLKSDTDYTIVFEGVRDLSANAAKRFDVQFKTRSYDIQAGAGSGTVNDTLLIRNHLIVAKEEGVEVYSTANPFDLELVSTLAFPGGARSFARYGDKVITVGGGVAPHGGVLRVLDFTDFQAPVIEKSFILSRYVGDVSDDLAGVEDPVGEGRPIKVMIYETRAYVANIGIGVQVVNLNELAQPITSFHHRKYSEPFAKDLALYIKEDDTYTPADETAYEIVLSGSSMTSDIDSALSSFKAVSIDRVLNQTCEKGGSTTSESRCQDSFVRSSTIPGSANNVEVLMNYEVDIDSDGRTEAAEDADHQPTADNPNPVDDGIVSRRDSAHTNPQKFEVHDLAFISGSTFGIHVLDITDIKDPQLLGTIKVGDGVSVYDLKLDRKNLRLYVPVGADGIYIVDIKDPFLIDPQTPPQVIGKIQVANTITDGNVTIDEELNTVYVATRDSGLQSVMVGNLQVQIVTKNDHGTADPSDDTYPPVSIIESEGYLRKHEDDPDRLIPWPEGTPLSDMQAEAPTKYYIAALLPSAAGGASNEVTVKVESTNLFDQPLKLAAGFPVTNFETKVKYVAPTDRNGDNVINEADGSYRLYVSDPFYITAHPLLPKADRIAVDEKIISAGDFIKAKIDSAIQQNLTFVTTDLLRTSERAAKALRMEWVDSEKPEPKQNAVTGSGETAYPPYLHSGEWSFASADFSLKGRGFDFVFSRKYESQALYDGPLGMGFDHAYFARILELPNGDVLYFDGMGRREHFVYVAQNGCVQTDENSCNAYVAPPGVFVKLSKLKDGNFLVTGTTGTNLLFINYGQLSYVQDRNENKLEFLYDPAGKLSVITDTLGRAVFYEYNDEGKLAKVRDFADREWQFNYDEQVSSPDPTRKTHLLTSVVTPKLDPNSEPRSTRYTYTGPVSERELLPEINLAGIIDGKGQQFLFNTFDGQDRLSQQQYGATDQLITYAYGQTTEGDPKTTVTDRNANITDYVLNDSGLLSKMVEYAEGEEIETLFEHNSEALLSKMTYPQQNFMENAYAAVDPTDKRKGPLLTTDKNTGTFKNPDGTEFEKTLTDQYEYHAHHNLQSSHKDALLHETKVAAFDTNDRNPKTIERPEGVIENYAYNKFGQVVSTVDAEAHTIAYEYYPESDTSQDGAVTFYRSDPDAETGGYLKSKAFDSSNLNLKYEYKYDKRGNIIEVKDPRGVTDKYTYNALDEVVEVIRAAVAESSTVPFHTNYKYDANGNVAEISMEKAPGEFSKVTFGYDILNYKTQTREEAGETDLVTAFEYDGNRNLTKVIQPEANATEYQYNSRDLKVAEIRGAGSDVQATWRYVYDKNKNLSSMVDSKGTTLFHYDNLDRLIRIAYPEGNTKSIEYNDDGQVVSEFYFEFFSGNQAELIAQKDFVYDALHRVTTETEHVFDAPAGDNVELDTSYDYDKDSQLTKVTDPLARQTHFLYDGAHRRKKVTDHEGNITEFSYDGNDNVTGIKESLLGSTQSHIQTAEYLTSNTYDSLNRVIETIDSLSHKTSFEYDLRNNLLASMDATGNVRSSVYDELNRRTKSRVVTGTGGDVVTDFSYDKNSRMVSFKDSKGSETTYSYDAINRLGTIRYPKGGEVRLTYDGNDNVVSTEDRNGTRVSNVFDGNNRLVSKNIIPGPGVIGTTLENFEYDGLNRLTRAQNNDSDVRFVYDSRGLIWKEIQTAGTTEMRFDKVGNKIKTFYPNQSTVLTRAYDELDRLRNLVTDTTGLVSDFSYLGTGRIADKTHGNGLTTQYNYDTEGKLFDIIHGANNSIAGFEYEWDDAHYRKKEIKRHFGNLPDSFNYDGAHRITAATVSLGATSHDRTFSYDEADNIKAVTRDLAPVNYTTNEEHQYTTSGTGEQFQYDANGNLTSYSNGLTQKTFAYDYMNRMMRAEITTGTQTDVVTFGYDALGRRVSKSGPSGTTKYVYEGAQVVQELDGANAIKREYIWGDSIDELHAIKQNGQMYYVHENSIGSVAAITDSTGALVERYDYDVFGTPTVTYAAGTAVDPRVSSLGQPYSFQGRERDAETGLFYFRARYYSAELGRFISQDPLSYAASGPSLYTFVHNSPVNLRDPLGLQEEQEINEDLELLEATERYQEEGKTLRNNPSEELKEHAKYGAEQAWEHGSDFIPIPAITGLKWLNRGKKLSPAAKPSAWALFKKSAKQWASKSWRRTKGKANKYTEKVKDLFTKSKGPRWTLPKEGGKWIDDRWYSEHALERMAADTPEVRAILEERALKRAEQAGLKPGTREFQEWWNKYGPDPRGIPPEVVEAEIANPGSTGIRVVLNESDDVVSVIPE